jgi:hypothetical protein
VPLRKVRGRGLRSVRTADGSSKIARAARRRFGVACLPATADGLAARSPRSSVTGNVREGAAQTSGRRSQRCCLEV